MKTSRSRFRRHLSYANVMATIAVFFTLGGVSYAATTISGNKLIKASVGAGKLKNGTLTSNQVKADSLTGSVIDESTLTTVPSAQNATSATTATTAGSANTAKSATTAGSADSATTADTADTAEHALSADSAEHALSADTAVKATEATNADTVEGLSAEQLEISCPAATELFGGMCWDKVERPLRNWVVASSDCAEAGGRLPSVSELVAYVLQPGLQVQGGSEIWSGDLNTTTGEEIVFARGEAKTEYYGASATSLGYRCLLYRVN